MLKSKVWRIVCVISSLALLLMALSCKESPEETTMATPAAQYTLKVIDATNKTYSDLLTLVGSGIKVQNKTVKIVAETASGEKPVYVLRNSILLQPAADGSYELIPEKNQLGVFIGAYPKGPDTIDIVWINVYYKSPSTPAVAIEPATLNGEVGKSYTFTARTENPPMIGSYEWQKNGETLGKGGGDTLTTIFPSAGTYKISVTVNDTFFDEIKGTGEATAVIK